ncbi:VPLPA-CTERM sorting domain-containing protein [Paracoccus subflavus]|uniref:VPLPA-CTERM sorting domain-containing protein n=1 Tax=Paracoccus subflavus TaxID=2528244 RepID=A0A4Q9FUJ5_9RHOB|nr:VPLPA-CTERM sorting domain-containing protein [Paracoccus subflavus]TBN36013.1 VPLPA-CTERM sorting domain-containing protein [Paracoccus subflavus]
MPPPQGITNFRSLLSGSASVSQLVADEPETPAPVPLPASALLLLGGVGGLAALRRRKKAA